MMGQSKVRSSKEERRLSMFSWMYAFNWAVSISGRPIRLQNVGMDACPTCWGATLAPVFLVLLALRWRSPEAVKS